MNLNSFDIVAENFKNSIRKRNREKIRAQKRKFFHFGCPPIQQIAQSLSLPSAEYSLSELLFHKWDQLVQFTQALETERVSLEGLLNFWSYLIQQIKNQKCRPNSEIFAFAQKFIACNKYQAITLNPNFQIKVLNGLHLIVSEGGPSQLKEDIFKWVSAIQGLPLLLACVQRKIYEYNDIGNIFRIVQDGLKHNSREIVLQSAQLISIILQRKQDYDLRYLYKNYNGIMNNLQCVTFKYMQSEQVQIFCNIILRLMSYCSSIVLDYCKMGLAYLSGTLIKSNNTKAVCKGLQILKHMTLSDNTQIFKFLLNDKQLQEIEMWSVFKCTSSIYSHSDIQIRKMAYIIMSNIIYKSEKEELLEFISQVLTDYQHNSDIFTLLLSTFKTQIDHTIIYKALNTISYLIYYGNQFEKANQNSAVQKIRDSQIDREVYRLVHHHNSSISQKAQEIIQSLKHYL